MFLLTSDLHLTDKPRDEYRWRIFPFLRRIGAETNSEYIFILGDLTDEKDNHSARLVNRICDNLTDLALSYKVVILRGNHDGLDPNLPYLKFVNYFSSREVCREIDFVVIPTVMKLNDKMFLFLPHSRDPKTEWEDVNFAPFDYVLMHQTFSGAVGSNGYALDGLKHLDVFPKKLSTKIISGDIHVPQRCGNVEYVGSPYHVHFNDVFTPRLIHINEAGGFKDINFPCPLRCTVHISDLLELKELKLNKGDQIKVKLKLKRSDYPNWATIKREIIDHCNLRGIELFGIELLPMEQKAVIKPEKDLTHENKLDTVIRYAQKESLDDLTLEQGKRLVEI